MIILQTLSDIVTDNLSEDAILNEEFTGFKQDYLVLHCLLKKYQPVRFLEVGTNMGTGTKIIKNALGPESQVFSLDLPTEKAHQSLQHPLSEGKGDKVGSKCNLPFTQLRGDSLEYDYREVYPINGWFIDGEHDFDHAAHESVAAAESGADIVIWHDADIKEVWNGIKLTFGEHASYTLFRVMDTRIAYALRNAL